MTGPATESGDVRGVCALGASAGGLDPLVDFLSSVPPDLGLAYLVVQHLSPDHESVMVRILERRTPMPVERMRNECTIRPNTVYVLGPGEVAALQDREITIVDRVPATIDPFQHRPIDVMFTSIASWGDRAVAVVLSGTGSDGTEGLAAVQASGGLALAQDDSAQFDGMPVSAERSGAVDARGSAAALAHLTQRFVVERVRPDRDQVLLSEVESEILAAVERSTSINFEDYKRATVRRRLEHRLLALGMSSHEQLLERLRSDADEADRLAHDLLIGVTSFYRDQNVFDQLAREVLPDLVRHAAEHQLGVRAWSAGCATGQEAYSLAMALVEARDQVNTATPIKLFATDVHDGSLVTASKGWYPEADMANVNPERRERFFTPEADGWRVRPELRGLLAFSRHNLLVDPPFTGIDLISCRNTLMYLSAGAQRDAFWAFGFSLRNGGALVLGETESVGDAGPDYQAVGTGLFRLINNRTSLTLRRRHRSSPLAPRRLPPSAMRPEVPSTAAVRSATYDLLLDDHGVGGIEIDRGGRLLHVYGIGSRWLRFRPGVALDDALALIEDVALRAAASELLRKLQSDVEPEPIDVSIDHRGERRILRLVGQSVTDPGREVYLVHGRLRAPLARPGADVDADDEGADTGTIEALQRQVDDLQQHLDSTKRQLDEAVRHQEYSEQQLTATNEELLVSNEELQTSIEELSSANEELRTVADENEARLRDVLALGADLEQVLNATDIGVLLLNADTTVRRFSGTCSRYFNILESDVGRPFDHIRSIFDDHELRVAVTRAATDNESVELLIEPSNGFEQTLRVTVVPYSRSGADHGVSLTLVDVTAARHRERQLAELLDRLGESLRVTHIALWEGVRGVDEVWTSDNFVEVSGVPPERWDEFPHLDSVHPDDVLLVERHATTVEQALARNERFAAVEYDYRIRDDAGQYRTVNVRVSAFERHGSLTTRAVLEDVTAQRRQTHQLQALNRDLEDFTNLAAHDLRSPLRGVRTLLTFLVEDHADALPAAALELIERAETRITSLQRMLDDLLDYARAGNAESRATTFDLEPWLAELCRDASTNDGIEVHASAASASIETEETLLSTCVRNLVDNAVKHHPGPAGTVRVTAQQAGDVVVVTVEDDGAGIPAADRERIFRPFQRLGPNSTGMGLATVHKLVSARSGTIDLRSKGDSGSVFTLVWPLEGAEQLAEAPPLIR